MYEGYILTGSFEKAVNMLTGDPDEWSRENPHSFRQVKTGKLFKLVHVTSLNKIRGIPRDAEIIQMFIRFAPLECRHEIINRSS